MTNVTSPIRSTKLALFGRGTPRLWSGVGKLITLFQRNRSTQKELGMLSDRDLADLGTHRVDLRHIVREHV